MCYIVSNMKDTHLTLRIPEDLARALERAAELRGEAKSLVVREAVARYLTGASAEREATRVVLGRELAERWSFLPILSPEERAALADDIDEARSLLPPARDPWG